MRITRLYLKNFIGIKSGMGKDEIEINFPDNGKKIILLSGKNGSGKTTILSQLQPFRESLDDRKDLIVPGTDGVKEIDYDDKGHVYHIKHLYPADGKKSQSFISKDGVELNENGGVRMFEDLVQKELGVTKDYFKIGRLGSNVTNFIELPTTKRKTYIMTFIESVTKYLNAHDIVYAKEKIQQKQLDQLALDLKKFDDIETVKKNIEDTKEHISSLQTKIAAENAVVAKLSVQSDDLRKKIAGIDFMSLKDQLAAKSTEYSNFVSSSTEFEKIHGKLDLKSCNDKIMDLDSELQKLRADLTKAETELAGYRERRDSFNNDLSSLKAQVSNLAVIDAKTLSSEIDKLTAAITGYKKEFFESAIYEVIKAEGNKVFSDISGFDDFMKTLVLKFNTLSQLSFDGVKYNSEAFFERGYDSSLMEYRQKLVELAAADQAEIDHLSKVEDGIDCMMRYKQNGVICDPNSKNSTSSIEDLENQLEKVKKDSEKAKKSLKEHNDAIDSYALIHNDFLTIAQSFKQAGGFSNKILNYYMDNNGGSFRTMLCRTLSDFTVSYNEFEEQCSKIVSDMKDHEAALNQLEIDKKQYQSYIDNEKSRDYFNKKIVEVSGNIEKIEKKMKEADAFIGAQRILVDSKSADKTAYTTYRDSQMYSAQLKTDIDSLNNSVVDYENSSKKFAEVSAELTTQSGVLQQLMTTLNEANSSMTQLMSAQMAIENIVKNLKEAQDNYDNLSTVEKALSPKSGIPWIFVRAYLGKTEEIANDLLGIAYNGKFLIHFVTSASDFFIRVKSGNNIIEDIKLASQGEISMTTISLSLALIERAIGNYRILCLDEIDGPLDPANRDAFLNILTRQIDKLGLEQVFVISHNNAFDMYPVSLILLPGATVNKDDVDFMKDKEVIYDANEN